MCDAPTAESRERGARRQIEEGGMSVGREQRKSRGGRKGVARKVAVLSRRERRSCRSLHMLAADRKET